VHNLIGTRGPMKLSRRLSIQVSFSGRLGVWFLVFIFQYDEFRLSFLVYVAHLLFLFVNISRVLFSTSHFPFILAPFLHLVLILVLLHDINELWA
jgi:hypothetical protein